nr:hypothetical protein [Mycoplasmopsis bovis]
MNLYLYYYLIFYICIIELTYEKKINVNSLIFASSFPMIATSCGVKKKDVETSRLKKTRIQNPTQNLNAENQDSRNKLTI